MKERKKALRKMAKERPSEVEMLLQEVLFDEKGVKVIYFKSLNRVCIECKEGIDARSLAEIVVTSFRLGDMVSGGFSGGFTL